MNLIKNLLSIHMRRRLFSYSVNGLILAMFVIVGATARGQVSEAWVARYHGGDQDAARALAVDAAGNVYVTGESYTATRHDYVTIKYDSQGRQLWAARYNGPANSWDFASAIAVDAAGNVYVTGRSEDARGVTDYATVKYDTNGQELWARRYNGLADSSDAAAAITLDASGNVYVSGRSYTSAETLSDFLTIKYDANGNILWESRTSGPGQGQDRVVALAVDAAGNVYVAGEVLYFSTTSPRYRDYAVVKYNASGQQLWMSLYDGGFGYDFPSAMVIDAAGNVYVTGESLGEHRSDYATVKYDTNGQELWARRYNGPGNHSDIATDLAVDAAGNVYVTGQSTGVSTDFLTIKYDTNGQVLWTARRDDGSFDEGAFALALDAGGNVYVTGYRLNAGANDFDYLTLGYSPGGQMLWRAQYDGPARSIDTPSAIAVDANRNVYITGQSWGALGDYGTIKYVQVPPAEPIRVVLSRDAGNNLRATITITNPTAGAIPGVTMTLVRASTLDGSAFVDGVSVPQSFGTINPGQSVTATVTFPGTASVPSGFSGLVRVDLSYTGGTYSETKQVVTP